jgi:hypothetical protein
MSPALEKSLIGFSPHKAATVLYNMIQSDAARHCLPSWKSTRPARVCLYIKKLGDVDQQVLKAIVVRSVAAMR